ncbi:ATP-binding protein [Streptomyces sp. NBC_01216]|uniref:ATP-binding protein n=1 Tax=unclassified Streptomyces TaxID=2593676 RepID=UPI002E14D485|nr:ATP-binding protein [Streptomyces sp. NBC_01216]
MTVVEACTYAPESMCVVRGRVRAGLLTGGFSAVVDDVVLVVAELVANAAFHGGPPVTLRVIADEAGRAVRVEVGDAGRGMDVSLVRARWRHPSFTLAERGRGLFLIDALCSGWGSDLTDGRHTTWAEITLPSDALLGGGGGVRTLVRGP